MKTYPKFAVLTFCLGAAGLVGFFQIEPREARAATVGGSEQYRILIPGSVAFPDEESFEAGLNKFAKEGWKVRTADAARVILAK